MALLALALVVLAILVQVGRKGLPARLRRRPAIKLTPAEARAILGVGPGAGPADIEAAYRRLMLRAHPDTGGTSGLAAQLNAARALLIKKS
jgi:DnaJ-domain-containing protein 1